MKKGVFFGILIVASLIFAFVNRNSEDNFLVLQMPSNEFLKVKQVITEEQFEKGLSGISRMKNFDGMFFAFKSPIQASFWMKEMQFPLDILYLNSDRRVIEAHLDEQPCLDQCPLIVSEEKNVQYVLEVRSGDAKKYGLEINEEIKW